MEKDWLRSDTLFTEVLSILENIPFSQFSMHIFNNLFDFQPTVLIFTDSFFIPISFTKW